MRMDLVVLLAGGCNIAAVWAWGAAPLKWLGILSIAVILVTYFTASIVLGDDRGGQQ